MYWSLYLLFIELFRWICFIPIFVFFFHFNLILHTTRQWSPSMSAPQSIFVRSTDGSASSVWNPWYPVSLWCMVDIMVLGEFRLRGNLVLVMLMLMSCTLAKAAYLSQLSLSPDARLWGPTTPCSCLLILWLKSSITFAQPHTLRVPACIVFFAFSSLTVTPCLLFLVF